MADLAAGDIFAPSCSYTWSKTGITFENSTNSTTSSITTIMMG